MTNQALAKHSILNQALKLVPFDGWHETTFETACKHAGFDEKYGYVLFPSGVKELVGYFIQECDKHMLEGLKTLPLGTMRVRDRIAAAITLRIRNHIPHKQAIPATLRFFALPQHSAQAMQALAHTSSEIWYAAGDNATDFNYYSKRFLLAGVYSSTLLFWLDDTSEDYKDTWAFLERRIDNVLQIGKTKKKCFNMMGDMLKHFQWRT